MPLTARDLDEIRRIVREELARALGATEARVAEGNATGEDAPVDPERLRLRKLAEKNWAGLRAGTRGRGRSRRD